MKTWLDGLMSSVANLFKQNKPQPMPQINEPLPPFGIDVSHHQGHINWPLVASNVPKVGFVFIKCTEGQSGRDKQCKVNANGAKAAGLKIGYYHFATLNDKNEVDDAKREARWFVQALNQLPNADLPLILDLEDSNPKVTLEDDEVLNWIKSFFAELDAMGYHNYALYSYTPFLETRLPKGEVLPGIRLWLAQYNNKPFPKMPNQFKDCWLWQFSATGRVKGISTVVDLNKTV